MNRTGQRDRDRRARWGTVALLVVSAGTLAAVTRDIQRRIESPYPLAATSVYDPFRARMDRSGPVVGDGDILPLEVPFKAGETVGDVLSQLDLDTAQAHELVAELAKFADLRRIRPRDRYAVIDDPVGGVRGFQLTVDGRGRAAVLRESDGWRGQWLPFRQSREVRRLEGALEHSLEGALRAAGAEPAIAYRMADVLQWDLDFTRDLRVGDTFEVLYEAVFLDGDYHALGDILAISYHNQGRLLEAYRFAAADGRGYYDGEGRPLRKMFLRSPLRYSRVTSRFSQRRFHPVLKRYRPHYGVDYGAPTGTPVRVTGNGTVVSAGWNGGGGRTVKVRHPNGYVTAYLHLSRFARDMRPGRRVEQGDVIGFVGSSGMSTASHLDYRIQHNGRWIDPLGLESVPAEPIAAASMASYTAERDLLRAALRGESTYRLAVEERAEFTVAAGDPVAAGSPVEAPPSGS